ncbi:MAG TPA: hypothetical protein VHA78_02040 [Candidatus Peribacteraceae bacterium]|nr:hypothetical protein [Candidatus Peribacteraceae bacterium]
MSKHTIIGHARQRAELASDLESGNVTHAYLFAGAPHLGKMTVAHWFARELLCDGKNATEKEEIIRQCDHLIHPDLLVLDQLWIEDRCDDFDVIAKTTNVPQQHRAKAPTAKTDTISIDDVREIQSRVQETGNSKFRVCIIRGIERMQEAAANAFLKTLEEPPQGRVFLLTTDAPSSVIPTILSRSRVLQFQRVSDKEINALLKDSDEDDRRFILHLAQGAPGVAVRLANDPDALREERQMHEQAMRFWENTSPLDRLLLLKPLFERGEESDRFLLHLSLALRETTYTRAQERALMELTTGLKTNAHRQLMTQSFALRIEN